MQTKAMILDGAAMYIMEVQGTGFSLTAAFVVPGSYTTRCNTANSQIFLTINFSILEKSQL
jgi:hypothetical protein